jgi:hypothetical protein
LGLSLRKRLAAKGHHKSASGADHFGIEIHSYFPETARSNAHRLGLNDIEQIVFLTIN